MPTTSIDKAQGLDERFMRRVHQANAGLSPVFGLLLAFAVSPLWGLGFFVMGMWSTVNLWLLERLLRSATRPSGRDPVAILVVAVVKLPILYGALIGVLWWGGLPAASVVTGLSVPMVVIFLKALGRVVSSESARDRAASAPASTDPSIESRS